MKYISYSLWGDNKVYTYGMVENIIVAKELYKGWTVRVHYNDTVPSNIIDWISKQDNTELIKHNGLDSKASNTFWRIEDIFIDNAVVLVRDADSRLNIREKAAVDEWLLSSKDFHIMRDHFHHAVPIMAGAFGCRNNVCKYLYVLHNTNSIHICPVHFIHGKSLLDKYINAIIEKNDEYMIDQKFLYSYIYPCVINNTFVHASQNKYEPFAVDFPQTDYSGFVGEVIHKLPMASKIFNEDVDEFERKPGYIRNL